MKVLGALMVMNESVSLTKVLVEISHGQKKPNAYWNSIPCDDAFK